MGLRIVPLSNSLGLGRSIADLLNAELTKVFTKTFPDGELYVRVEDDLSGDDVVVIQSLYPNQNTSIIELLLGIDAVRRCGASRVIAVVPYLAYSRQDRQFLKGEAVSSYVLLSTIKTLGTNYLLTIDAHSDRLKEYFGNGFTNILPMEIFSKYLIEKEGVKEGSEDAIIVAPDKGAEHRARALSEVLRINYVVIKKVRNRYTGEIKHEFPKEIDVKGKIAVVVDDIISTGGTVASIAKFLNSLGTEKVVVLASHGLFVGNAIEKLRRAGVSRVVIIKTVGRYPSSDLIEVIDPSALLARHLRNLTLAL